MIIDAWMQHFGESQLIHPMFASLRRWTRQSFAPVTQLKSRNWFSFFSCQLVQAAFSARYDGLGVLL